MGPVSLVELLNEIGGRNAIGRMESWRTGLLASRAAGVTRHRAGGSLRRSRLEALRL